MAAPRDQLRSAERSEALPAALREVFFCISRAFYAYIARLEELLEENELAAHVRPGMGHVLFALFDEDDVIIKRLVAHTELSPSTLTRLLTEMERRGLVTRQRDADDGRAVRVRLTPLGRSLEARCQQTRAQMHRLICGQMSGADVNGVICSLTQMIANLRRQEPPAAAERAAAGRRRSKTPRRGARRTPTDKGM